MTKYFAKLVWLLLFCLLGAWLIFVTNGEKSLEAAAAIPSRVVLRTTEKEEELNITESASPRILVLYSPDSEVSLKYKENLEIALKHLRMQSESVEIDRTDSVSYQDYNGVVLATECWSADMQEPISRLMDYVENGGALFVGMLPEETEGQFRSAYRKFGIIDYGEFIEYDNLHFEKELVPGIAGMAFEDEAFTDVGISMTLEERAQVYASAKAGQSEIPVIWSYKCGEGKITFYNGTAMRGDFWRGIAAGCITSLFDTAMYPVINAMNLFIDDFPSPQYESTSDVVRKDYNRSVKEFYRDIWWPDMQVIANKYNDVYTGLFVATYNDIVDPGDFVYENPSMEQYYGNSLLKNGYEMGAHGYNHQSLTLEGGTPDSMGYNPWKSTEDMAASIFKLEEITEQLFPAVSFYTYVPPSNYLSAEGRMALKQALPELEVISGIYTDEGEEGSVYVQDFEIAEDGIAEYPRITSGMMPTEFEVFTAMSGMGLYGVFSHFIHPDDIFDEERGKNQNWESLYESYCELIEWVHKTYPFLRSVSARDAGKALKVEQEAVPHLIIEEKQIKGSVENFMGEVFFYLKTDRTPMAADASCSVEIASPGSNTLYYLVTVKQPNFSIKLVDK